MRHGIGSLLIVLLAAVVFGQQRGVTRQFFVQSASSAPAGTAMDLVSGYQDAATALTGRTKVPLRLPMFVPYADDKSSPVFAAVVSVTVDSYQVELAWAADCNGAGACHLGYLNGSASPLTENKGRKVPVALKGGTQGYFIDTGCGANCGDSAIYWTEGNYHYSITMKAETKDTLTKMANSAVRVRLK